MGKTYDLRGLQFGQLKVLEKTDNPNNHKNKKIFWKCLCECGNETIVSTTDLRSGKTTQCIQCAHKQSGLKRRKNIIGKTFDYLTVISVDYTTKDNNSRSRTRCHCKCKCGNEVTVLLDTLSNPAFHSCGCALKMLASSKVRDITGERFGKLLILEEYDYMTPRRVKCQCDCGNIVDLRKGDVMSGHTKSCGCLFKEAVSISNTKDWTGTISEFGVKFISPTNKNEYGAWLWNCECPCCHNIFVGLPSAILSGKTTSCGCRIQSAAEVYIEKLLKESGVDFQTQYTIDDCRDVNVLRFDFAVFVGDDIRLIEYDGRQHFEPIKYFGGEEAFRIRMRHDRIKTFYCLDHNISLTRIFYDDPFDEIQNTINKIIQP